MIAGTTRQIGSSMQSHLLLFIISIVWYLVIWICGNSLRWWGWGVAVAGAGSYGEEQSINISARYNGKKEYTSASTSTYVSGKSWPLSRFGHPVCGRSALVLIALSSTSVSATLRSIDRINSTLRPNLL
jgi:hypothetical protein